MCSTARAIRASQRMRLGARCAPRSDAPSSLWRYTSPPPLSRTDETAGVKTARAPGTLDADREPSSRLGTEGVPDGVLRVHRLAHRRFDHRLPRPGRGA